MKKRTFIATIAVAIIAGVSIFMACTKEEISVSASSNKPDNKLSYESELEAAGQMHNNILYALGSMIQGKLDSCATMINSGNFYPDDEAFMLQVVEDSLTKLITQTTICTVSEDSMDFIFDQIDYYLSDDYFDFEFTNSASDIALSNILTANSNATNTQPILCDISTAIDNIDMTTMSYNDSVTLASLILFNYSLNFWSDAYANI